MNLYDLMDVDIENINNVDDVEKNDAIEIKKRIDCIDWIDSIEYLKYSHQYLHDKQIIASTSYKNKYKEKYKLFKEIGLIGSSEKYTLEHYIKMNYRLINSLLETNSKKLQEKKLLTDPKKFFIKEKIHDKVEMTIEINDQTIKGTLFDKALSFIYDGSIDFLTVVRSCKSVELIDELIVRNKILDSNEMVTCLFKNDINKLKEIIGKKFTNMLPCKMIYSHQTRTYGYPDFIADDWIIDIKTSKKSVINMKNYLQVISYAICSNINNVCLYDIENGYIYKGNIKDETIEKIKRIMF